MIGLALLILGPLLVGTSAIHFELVADVKQLPLLKRWLYWLRGRKPFMKEIQDNQAQIPNMIKGIPPKKHWRTGKTPTVIGISLTLIGFALSLDYSALSRFLNSIF
jgi:hypothetical protein